MGPPLGRPATALRDESLWHVGVRRAGRHGGRLTPQPGRRIPFEGEARGGEEEKALARRPAAD